MKSQWLLCGPLAVCLLFARLAISSDETLEEIVVTATLRSTSVADLPQSVTVIDRDTLRSAGVQHFEDVLDPHPRSQLGRGNFASALFPAPWYRRGRTIPRRAQPFRRISDR
jgi:outer membrane receptor protein involved in Fe transport